MRPAQDFLHIYVLYIKTSNRGRPGHLESRCRERTANGVEVLDPLNWFQSNHLIFSNLVRPFARRYMWEDPYAAFLERKTDQQGAASASFIYIFIESHCPAPRRTSAMQHDPPMKTSRLDTMGINKLKVSVCIF